MVTANNRQQIGADFRATIHVWVAHHEVYAPFGLINLHWLPVEFRITFKVLLLVYKALHGLAPSNISDLLNFKTYSRSLRSSCKEYLVVPRSRLKTYGDRAFSIAGPNLWNDLPLEIRKCASVATFKQSLKTFLFKLAYRL